MAPNCDSTMSYIPEPTYWVSGTSLKRPRFRIGRPLSERRAHRSGLRIRRICRLGLDNVTHEFEVLEPWHETPLTIGEEKREPWPIWEPE